jgi:hypothetical protein
MRNLWKCLLPAVLLAMVGPATAQAESLVYIKGGDVYLTGVPGTVRVTADGNYESSSQADDGTIVAVQKGVDNDGQTYRYLIRMNRSGKRLNPPAETIDHISTYSGPLNAKVSPDGRLVAYQWLAGGPLLTPGPYFSISDSGSSTPKEKYETSRGYNNPNWLDSSRILLFNGSGLIQTYNLAAPKGSRFQDWFTDREASPSGGEVNAQGDKLVSSANTTAGLVFYPLPGPPPTPPVTRCLINLSGGGVLRPTWNPDGSELAWQQGDGIHLGVVDLPGCRLTANVLAVPGGSYPDFGPANVAVPRPTATVPRRASRSAVRAGLRVRVRCAVRCRAVVSLIRGRRVVRRVTRTLTGTVTVRPKAALPRGTRRISVRVKALGRTITRSVIITG